MIRETRTFLGHLSRKLTDVDDVRNVVKIVNWLSNFEEFLEKEKANMSNVSRVIGGLRTEITTLQAQVADKDAEIASLKDRPTLDSADQAAVTDAQTFLTSLGVDTGTTAPAPVTDPNAPPAAPVDPNAPPATAPATAQVGRPSGV